MVAKHFTQGKFSFSSTLLMFRFFHITTFLRIFIDLIKYNNTFKNHCIEMKIYIRNVHDASMRYTVGGAIL